MKLRLHLSLALIVTTLAASIQAQSTNAVRHHQALQHYRAGQELLQAEQFEKAAVEFSAAVEVDPLFALAYYGLGQSYVAVKRYASAILAFTDCREAYRKIIALRDEDRAEMETRIDDEVRELQSMVSRIRGGHFSGYGEPKIIELEARIDELRRIRQEPVARFRPPAEVSLALGSAYFRSGDRERAEAEWRAAVDVNPRLGEAHNNLAVVYMLTGRLELAEEAMKAAERSGYRVNPQFKQDLRAKKQQLEIQ